jgi:Spy/CpxP family protein refolding chaperone
MSASGGHPGDFGRATFGVRRPLRLLAYKLGLEAEQVRELARILDQLKTERAQAEVEERRTVAAFADALAGATFEEEKARQGATLRVKSTERLQEAVVPALGQLHALLNVEQRAKLAYLIRTGVFAL